MRCFRLPKTPFRSRNSGQLPVSLVELHGPIKALRIRVWRRFSDTGREESYLRAFLTCKLIAYVTETPVLQCITAALHMTCAIFQVPGFQQDTRDTRLVLLFPV